MHRRPSTAAGAVGTHHALPLGCGGRILLHLAEVPGPSSRATVPLERIATQDAAPSRGPVLCECQKKQRHSDMFVGNPGAETHGGRSGTISREDGCKRQGAAAAVSVEAFARLSARRVSMS